MANFEGAVVLVTGAARGIGRAIAMRFAEAGADVAGNDLDRDGLDSLQADVQALGRRAIGMVGDVASEEVATSIVEQTSRELGRIDVLVNNAGIWIIKSLEETSVEEWDLQISTNLRSLYLLTRRAAPAMRATGGGSIINLASMAASRFTVPHVAYASSKAGVVAFTRDMAVELAPDHIRVNAVAPGPIDTRGLLEGLSDKKRLESQKKFLLGRMGTPDDIAGAVAFLAGPDASYITGVTLPVTGGAELSIRPIM